VSQFGFPREEHLKLKERIDFLFDNGARIKAGAISIIWTPSPWPLERGVQVLLNAPKRRFRLAVRRNKIKRVLREAWRLERGAFPDSEQPILMGILYHGKETVELSAVRGWMRQALSDLEAARSAK